MADVKISQLPSATLPLTGAELVPLVQGGVTKNVPTTSLLSAPIASNLNFTGTGNRITGDFSNATLANRVYFQNSVTNGATSVGVIPNGTGASSACNLFANSDPTNTSFVQLRAGTDTGDIRLSSSISGTGSYLPLTLYTGGSERVRVDTSGNVGIGTSSGNTFGKLAVSGADDAALLGLASATGVLRARAYNTATTGALIESTNAAQSAYTNLFLNGLNLLLGTGNTERARIDSAGLMGIGMTTAGTVRLAVASSSGFIFVGRDSTGVTDQIRIVSNGNVQNLNNVYGAISDVKLKENIVDATPKLDKLQQVRVVNYNLIGESQKQIGVVAQELEQVFPGMVEEAIDRDNDGNDLGTTTKSVKYSVFVPILIKAIQELKAEFDAYKATHP